MAKKQNPKTSEDTNIKKKKSKKSGPNAVAMKQKAPKPNPFETIWSRRKFDILGKKRKGEERRMGLARSIGIEKRKNTLLKEYEQSGKASVFIDKRIGEQNDALGEFDKAIMRSQRERQLKVSKKSKFNLSDGEEDEFGIQGDDLFSARDDFEGEELPEYDDDAELAEKNSAILNQLGSQNPLVKGSTEGEEHKHKSKKEVMDEIILKSKYFKAQKAKDKEENEQLTEQLDSDFTSLVQSEALLSLTQPGKMNALKALVNKRVPNEFIKKDELSDTQRIESLNQDKPDSYDKLLKEMILERRARPSDRTKTPEEIAQDERERLEQLEEERQKRMLGADDSSDEDSEAHEEVKPSTQRLRSISGDDLGDSFSLDEELVSKKGFVDEILERRDAEDLESEDDESDGDSEDAEEEDDDDDDEGSGKDNDEKSENALSLKDWEQSDDDKFDTDLEEDEEEEEHDEDEGEDDMEPKGHRKKNKLDAIEIKKKITDSLDAKKLEIREKQPSVRQDSIPFVIEAPNSLEELSRLLDNRSNEDIIAAITRIRVCNAISLKAENRKKMQVFYGVLLQYFAVLANKKPLNLKLLNLLVKPLMEMSVEIPYFAAICARQRILRTRMQLCEDIKNPDKSCWPSLKTLSLLRLWSMIFPCSDFRHVVMTPAILLMCEYLMRCPIVSGRDIAIGTFLCSIVLSVTKQSRKFSPEAIMFLQTLLMASVNRKQVSSQDSQFYYLLELKALKPLLCIHGVVNEIAPLNFLTIMDMPEDSPLFSSDNFRASVLVSVIETLRGFVNVYEEFKSFPELFLPMSKLVLEVANQENMPNTIQDTLKDVAKLIMKKADECHMLRQPLQMRKQKPVPLRTVAPKFEENFVKGRDYDPDRERAESKKLKKLVKREEKGAIRELRKDNASLYEAKQRKNAVLEEERAEKYGKARAFLQEQEHAFKSGQLGKGKKRRR